MEKVTNRFNLVDEPWIPVVGVGIVSLSRIFSDPSLRALGGNPVQKIAVTKLLLAIAQASATPRDEAEWEALGAEGLAAKSRAYLSDKKDCFWLYGEKPFLQMRSLTRYKEQTIGTIIPYISTGNTTILNQSQVESPVTDSEWALILIVEQNFSLKGTKAYGALTADDSKGKGKATKSGPALGPKGNLHSFVILDSVLQTVYLNLLTQETVSGLGYKEVGFPAWEFHIDDRTDKKAQSLQNSLLGRLCPLSRFIVKDESRLQYCEGIIYSDHRDGVTDPSIAKGYNEKSGTYFVLSVDPLKRPWRELTALLSFFSNGSRRDIICPQLRNTLTASRLLYRFESFTIWSGGVVITGDSYEQYPKSDDDFVESELLLKTSFLKPNCGWISVLDLELTELEMLATELKNCTYNNQKREIAGSKERDKRADALARNSQALFWQLAERQFQALVDACTDAQKAKDMRKIFAAYAQQAYDAFCPKDTARQLDAWAANKPHLGKYLA